MNTTSIGLWPVGPRHLRARRSPNRAYGERRSSLLHRDDFARFKEHFEAARKGSYEPSLPMEILAADDGLYPAELFRLTQSLQVAGVAGDVETDLATILRTIIDKMG